LSLVEEEFLGRYRELFLLVIAEAVGHWLENGKGFEIGLLLRSVHAAGREWHADCVTSILGTLLDASTTGEDDEVGEGNLFSARLSAVELGLDAFEGFEDLGELLGLVDFPILLRGQADAAAIGSTALVGATECGG
jgi:hypothetical protein